MPGPLRGLRLFSCRGGLTERDVYGVRSLYTSDALAGWGSMRTNIVIDDALMRQAMQASGARSKREAVELGLRTLLRLKEQEEIKRFRGKLDWQGDLDAMRTDK